MHIWIRGAALVALLAPAALVAQTPPPAPSAPAPSAPAATPQFSTATTTLGALIENEATRAVVERHLPGISQHPMLDQARGFTLRMIQQFAPDQLSNERLDAIDRDLSALPTPAPAPATPAPAG
jgi:hypothetical protein